MSLASYQLLHSAIFRQAFLSFAGAKVRLFCEMTKRKDGKMHWKYLFCSRVQKEMPVFLHESYKSATFAQLNEPDIMPQLKTRQLLVDVARQLFAKNGFDSTTMNDIAEFSGKGRRTLYTYFKNKEEVYSAVIDAELMRISTMFLAVARRQLPPLEKLVELLFAHLSLMKEAVERNGNLRSAFFRNIWKVGSVRKKYDKKEHDIFAKTLEEGRQAGIFDIDDVVFYTDIIQATAKGLEVPYIYGRLGVGMNIEVTRPMVTKILHRALGME